MALCNFLGTRGRFVDLENKRRNGEKKYNQVGEFAGGEVEMVRRKDFLWGERISSKGWGLGPT